MSSIVQKFPTTAAFLEERGCVAHSDLLVPSRFTAIFTDGRCREFAANFGSGRNNHSLAIAIIAPLHSIDELGKDCATYVDVLNIIQRFLVA
jgi:hypothetical protein